jgi:3-oxoadipate enol-lactonase
VPTLTANGIDIYYERWGSGPRLLFLNGSGTELATTRFLVELFAEGFEVVVHDQRGLGRTSIPDGPYTMAEYAADAAALLDHAGWASARVVGVSFGGMVAQELTVTWPERIERLALACTSPGGAAGASYPLHELESLPADEAAAMGVRLLDSRFTDEWLAEHPDDRGLAEMMTARAGAERSQDTRRGQRLQLEARRGHDVSDRLGAVSCPTLVACGKYDGIAPLPNAEAIAARVPDAQLRIYEGGHAFFAQDPAALPEIRGFLADGG